MRVLAIILNRKREYCSFILNFCEILLKFEIELHNYVVIASNNYDNYASGKEKNKQVKVNRIPIQTNFSWSVKAYNSL